MKTKKIVIFTTILAITFFVYSGIASAAGYIPLVQIPGVPVGPITLSSYLVGIYNFLLSIVGIVAVMMLIVGGIRYISAAGNAAAIGDAKDIISSAVIGLLLALLSWVIVSAINPDILFIQSPTATLGTPAAGVRDISCTITNSPCLCNDGVALPAVVIPDNCPGACRDDGGVNHCVDYSNSFLGNATFRTRCIAIGSSNEGITSLSLLAGSARICSCIDGATTPKGAFATCHDACSNPVNFHCLVTDLRGGLATTNYAGVWPPPTPEEEDQIANSAPLRHATQEDPLYITEEEWCHLVVDSRSSFLVDPGAATWDWDLWPPFDHVPSGAFGPAFDSYWVVDCIGNLSGVYAAITAAPGLCNLGFSEQYNGNAWICPITVVINDGLGHTDSDWVYVGFIEP